MKVKICMNDHEYEHDIPIGDIATYLELLNAYTVMDEDGDVFMVSGVNIDAFLNIVEVFCVKEE